MERKLLTAVLRRRTLLSQQSQTWQLDFEASEPLSYTAGQFYSFITERNGKEEVRAYSLIHAPDGGRLSLCLNRAGFFSGLLIDLPEGSEVRCHGPYGAFVLREEPGIILADGPGIAPVAAMIDALLTGQARCAGPLHLLHSAASEADLFYKEIFAEAEGTLPEFHYHPLSAGVSVEEEVKALLPADGSQPTAYIVGLNAFAAPLRQFFKDRGWDRKEIVFERYD